MEANQLAAVILLEVVFIGFLFLIGATFFAWMAVVGLVATLAIFAGSKS